MPTLTWVKLLINRIPDKYEHLVRHHVYYSSRFNGVIDGLRRGRNRMSKLYKSRIQAPHELACSELCKRRAVAGFCIVEFIVDPGMDREA
jgi:hypothetical protein